MTLSLKSKNCQKLLGSLSLAIVVVAVLASGVRADDVDIFNPSAAIEPNVLYILDTSGSMNNAIPTATYDPDTVYGDDVDSDGECDACTYDTSAVYKQDRNLIFWLDSYTEVCSDIDADPLVCSPSVFTPTAGGKTQLLNTGFWFPTSSIREFHGNYLNFKELAVTTSRPKIDIAKEVLNELIDTSDGIRMGYMTYNSFEGGTVDFDIATMDATNKTNLKNTINASIADGWTPTAEVLYEAGLYYAGDPSYYNAGTYTSPITASCHANYAILLTDGASSEDLNLPAAIGDRDGDGHEPGGANEISYASNGSDYLDDVAKYWLDTDMIDDSSMPGKQSMKTFAIGFDTAADPLADPLLRATTDNGDGLFFSADDAAGLKEVLRSTLVEISEDTTSFIGAVVPIDIDQSNRTTNGDFVYLSLFAPSSDALWAGNLKKFELDDQGALIDANGDPATDSDGNILDSAVSFWNLTTSSDGSDVRKGGVEGVLQARVSARKIYTALGTTNDLTDASNAFIPGNGDLTVALLDTQDEIGRGQLIKFVRGEDSYDDDADGDVTEKREKQMGDLLHSRPVVVRYDSTTKVIYVGSNDGMLHAFDDSNGEELWAFIPADQLSALKDLRGTTHAVLVDGPVQTFVADANADNQIVAADGDKAIVLFGRRRGGSTYTALDVTDPASPQFLYEIDPSTSGFEELGQSWSRPLIGKVKVGATDTHVAIISGGYDLNHDNVPVTLADTMGRGVFAFNVLTGAKVWDFAYDVTDTVKAQMEHAIASDISGVDINADGYLDRLYVGDLGGQLWRFEGTSNSADITSWAGKIIFEAKESTTDTAQRKFFHPPDVVQHHAFDVVLIGTGDRENPLETTPVDRFYSIRDDDPASPYIETDLVDVTDDLIQTGTSTQKATVATAIRNSNGYFIRLVEDPADATGIGEKILSAPITFLGTTLFTSFIPNNSLAVCSTGGVSRLYAVDFLTGIAVQNFYANNDSGGDPVLAREDRYYDTGASMASSPVIILRKGKAISYVGTGAGVTQDPLPSPPSNLLLLEWEQIW